MITLLLGTDSIAKKNYISEQAKKLGAETQTYNETTALPPIASLFEQQLFGGPQAVVLTHCWKKIDSPEILEQLLQVGENKSANLFVIEDTLDKRKKVNQEFLKDKRVTVLQFNAPIGTKAASDWIIKYADENKIKIESAASLALARALLIDEDSVLDVARAQTELAKLNSYAAGKAITSDVVAELTENIIGVDIFELLNSIATKNKKQALRMLEQYFVTESTDEKASAIKIAALLSDQFRSLLLAMDAGSRGLPDAKVLEMTGWKSGRLFIMKKLSRNFNPIQMKQALSKLENLDRELKTGSMPPHVVLDLIIADM